MRKGSKNQIISALTVGLSAMMALSTPMSAYAAEGDLVAPTNPTPVENTNETESTHQSEIQAVAAEVPVVESSVADITPAAEEIAVSPVTEEQAGNYADDAVADANQKAEAVVGDNDIATVNNDLAEVKSELATAQTEDKKADSAAKDAVDSLTSAEDMAGKINDDITDAAQQVATITQQMQNATTADDVKDIYEQVESVLTNTAADVELKEKAFNSLVTQYGNAKADLLQAEDNYQQALTDASIDAGEAKQILDDMTERVDALETAVNKAETLLNNEATASKAIADQKKVTTVDWNKQRDFMYSIVKNYYIPQLVDPDATNIVIHKKTPGFDKQDNNYTKVTYTDKAGVEKTLYFNYDRTDKVLNEADRYNNVSLGKSLDIVVFTKEQDEIDADAHIKQYYASQNLSDATIKNMAKQGMCDVFKYQKDGKTVYLTRQEVKDGVTAHTISGDDASGYTVNGIQLELVVQNKNSAVHNNVNTVNTQSEQFKNFVASMPTLAAEYTAYAQQVEQAQSEIKEAQAEAKVLKDAIDDLKGNQTNRVIKAIEVLGVEDLATYFGLEDLTDDEAAMLNKMTVRQAVKYLDERLENAKKRVDEAKSNLADLETAKNQIGQILEDMQEAENTPAGGGTGDVSSDITPVVTINDDQPVPLAPTPSTGGTAVDVNAPGDNINVALAMNLLNTNPGVNNPQGVLQTILDGDTPLAATPDSNASLIQDTTGDTVPAMDDSGLKTMKPISNITDDQVAKSATPDMPAKKGFSYWWLLILAALAIAEKTRREIKKKSEENKPQQ